MKKQMKKNLSGMLAVLLMATFLFPTIGNAADDTLTTQQKYDALATKGIFAGMTDGSDGLDQNMTRAQFARVSALILGLEDISATDTNIVKEKPFSDVELGLWYTDEIAAAKKAGVFVGNADGTFNPKSDITVQELAVVVAGLLGLEKVEDATVEGAADWAAGYIQSLINAKVDFPTNYTAPASREDFAVIAYQAEETLALKKAEQKKAEEEAKKKAEEEAKKKAEEEAKKKAEEEAKKQQEEQSSYTPPVQATTNTPTAYPAAGAVNSGTPVTLTSATVSAALYYTTDLSEPTTSSTLYTGPITITSNTTIKVIAVKSGSTNSSVATFVYTVTNTKQAALDLINAYYRDGIGEAPDETTFADAEVTGVTNLNLSDVDYALEWDEVYPHPWTESEIQDIVDSVLEGLAWSELGNYFFTDDQMEFLTAEMFRAAGISGVNDDNLEFIIEEIVTTMSPPPYLFNTKEDLQAIVDIVNDRI